MEQNILFQDENPVKGKILTIGNRTGLVWSEIAKVTGINKKIIKAIAKDELIPGTELSAQLCKIFDDTIARLNIEQKPCHEADLDGEDYKSYKLDVKSVTIYKETNDDKMILQIHGVVLT